MNSPSRLTQRLGFRLSFLLAVTLLPLGVISTMQARALQAEARARSEAALLGTTRAAAAREVSAIQRAQGVAEALAQVVTELDDDPVACSNKMQSCVRESGLFSFVGYWQVDGTMDCSSDGRAAAPRADREHGGSHRQPRTGDPGVSIGEVLEDLGPVRAAPRSRRRRRAGRVHHGFGAARGAVAGIAR